MKIVSSQSIKKGIVLTASVALCALIMSPSSLSAQTTQAKKGCEYRTLSMKINSDVKISEVLSQLSEKCDFSIIFVDAPAIEIANQPLYGTNIKDKSLFETLDILVASNNLNYEYKSNVLRISALDTKSFKIDYITSVRQGTATMSASVNSAPRQVTSGGEMSIDRSDNEIVVKEEFDFWNTINEEVGAILNTGKELYIAKEPIINARAGLITITATKDQLSRIEEYFNTLKDRLSKQVLIDVTILSVELNDDNRMGIDWSKFQLGFFGEAIAAANGINTGAAWSYEPQTPSGNYPYYPQFGRSGGNGITSSNSGTFNTGGIVAFGGGTQLSLDGVFNFLKDKGKTSVVSNPKVLTLNNQQALITVGDTINYQTRSTTVTSSTTATTSEDITNYSLFVGILLNILPTVSENDNIMLRINPSLSDFKYREDDVRYARTDGTAIPRTIAPDTVDKKLSTVVNVKNGDTIILGGLITNNILQVNKGVPILGSIPILGYAFKYAGEEVKTKELVFIITPRVVGEDTSVISPESLKDLGYNNILEK
ncbi:MAG: pilus (MSHA type) biogenesis protein MshL [Campylobacteraceae bacterium]|jgi:general secretion pathway protein D|nr:pilus (MSHA type) biogenesis protein MshL [Campylobacteraceae bacterium]